MGRGVAVEPVPVAFVRANFAVRDGTIVKANGSPATFTGPNGVAMVRLRYNGHVRRLSAGRVAYALTKNEWPVGLLAKPCHHPHAAAGRASALACRAKADLTLIKAMNEAPNVSIAQLSAMTGSPKSCTSARLTRLAERGLTESPKCCPGKSWALSAQGQALAAADRPILDDFDREILLALPGRIMTLAAQTGVCPLTIRRRVDRMAAQKLVALDERRRFVVTDEGRKALPHAPPKPPRWIDATRISAAVAKDVLRRLEHPTELPPAERSRLSSEIATRARKARGSKWVYHSALAG